MKVRIFLNCLIDWFVIIVEITYMISIVYCVLFDNIPIHPYISLIITVLLCHLYRFGLKIRIIELFKNSFTIKILFIILIFDVLQNILFFSSTMCIAILINAFLFLNYLSNCFVKDKKPIGLLIQPYVVYSMYNVITSIIIFCLFFVGVSYQINEVAYSVMNSNINNLNIVYYFPYNMAVASNYHSEMGGFPVVSGLSHEPNAIMYVILPSFFFILGRISSNFLKYFLYILFLVMLGQTTSTTAISVFFICIVIEALWSYRVKKEKTLLVFLSIVAIFISYMLYDYFELVYQLVSYKLKNEDNSGGTSAAMLAYLFKGGSLVGTGHFPPVYGLDLEKSNYGAGLIIGLLDLVLYISLIFHAFRLVISKTNYYHYIGLGSFYYLIHSLKVGYMIFWYPYFMFMIFVLIITSKELKLKSNVDYFTINN